MNLEPALLFGFVSGLGAVFRVVWSFLNLKKDDPTLKWSWLTFSTEAFPIFAVGFLAGTTIIQPLTTVALISAFFAGAGLISVATKAIDSWKNRG